MISFNKSWYLVTVLIRSAKIMKLIPLIILLSISSMRADSNEQVNNVPIDSLDAEKAVTKYQNKYSAKEAQKIIDLLTEYKKSFKIQEQDCRIVEGVMMSLEPSKIITFQSKSKVSKAVSFSIFTMTKDYSVLQVQKEVGGKEVYWTSEDSKFIDKVIQLANTGSVAE